MQKWMLLKKLKKWIRSERPSHRKYLFCGSAWNEDKKMRALLYQLVQNVQLWRFHVEDDPKMPFPWPMF